MKRLFTIVLLAAIALMPDGYAQSTARKVWIEKVEANVRLTGWFAQTEYDITFRNDGDRAEEGEFALPLPPGATVSGYALDVNGLMREAVAVEKERARTAYETVKRRMIDPGIVEREAENIYRTKVYPIPASGTKRLIIRYHERLAEDGDVLRYRLPFVFDNKLGSFTCRVRGKGYEFVKNGGLEFSADGSGDQLATLADDKPQGGLELKIETPPDGTATVDSGDTPSFHLRLRKTELPVRPLPHPKTVMLLWDASGSMRGADHGKTFALLDAWFAKLGNTQVRLRLVRNEIEAAGDFDVRKGGWKTLRRALETVSYDGASDFSRINVAAADADFAVWVTDGRATLGDGIPKFPVPLALIGCGDFSGDNPVVRKCFSFGASVIDAAREKREQALAKLTHQSGGLLQVTGNLVGETIVDHDPASGCIEIFGSVLNGGSPKLSLLFGNGNEVALTREIAFRPHGGPNLMERILAQRQLSKLESDSATRSAEIIAHCMKHGLVSDFTSLIVLERIEDYAEHGIVPPEPELREKYDALVRSIATRRMSDPGGLAYEWELRTAWHARRFPGPELVILPRMKQVGIWRRAVESQFPPERRDMKTFNTLASWHDRAVKLVAGKAALKTRDDYDKWLAGIHEVYDAGFKLTALPLSPPPQGSELAVSVRGLVDKPGIVKGDAGMTLRQAVAKAGGPGDLGSMDNVALYRNAGKTVYNTLSEQFKDVPLYPADMIVVGAEVAEEDSGWDPFAERPAPPDPTKDKPIRSEADIWVLPRAERERIEDAHAAMIPVGMPGFVPRASVHPPANPAFPMVQASPDAIRPQPDTAGEPIKTIRVPEAASGVFTTVEMAKQLDAGKDAGATYGSLRAHLVGNPAFYPEAARLLAARKHDALARRALSNLAEDGTDPVASKRAYAFWLAEIGQADEAERVLRGIGGDERTELLALHDLASIHSARGQQDAASQVAWRMLEILPNVHPGPLAGIALTGISALGAVSGRTNPRSSPSWMADGFRSNLHADIRIVVTAASEACDVRLVVTEPGNLANAEVGRSSPFGGRLTGASGVKEYIIRRAVPGIHKITCAVSHPTTLRIEIQTDFGRPQQKTRVLTVFVGHQVSEQITELDFPFRAH
jgi:hypothetical protein